ncbi:hypothetical protein HOY80DRAFT_1046404 [Tuber brumale]|nr:hypothetical protein HOY80DRAFT_1046404 [Tuber brumale]
MCNRIRAAIAERPPSTPPTHTSLALLPRALFLCFPDRDWIWYTGEIVPALLLSEAISGESSNQQRVSSASGYPSGRCRSTARPRRPGYPGGLTRGAFRSQKMARWWNASASALRWQGRTVARLLKLLEGFRNAKFVENPNK